MNIRIGNLANPTKAVKHAPHGVLDAPPQYLVRVTADKLHRHCTWPYGTAPEAMVFATRAVPYARTIDQVGHPAIDTIIANWKQLELAAVFDHLIANDDRSEKNLLLDAQRQLWLIDHARSLGGAGQRLFSQDVFPSYKNFLIGPPVDGPGDRRVDGGRWPRCRRSHPVGHVAGQPRRPASAACSACADKQGWFERLPRSGLKNIGAQAQQGYS